MDQYAKFSSSKLKNVLKVQSEVRKALSNFLREKDFVEISPVIISPITDPLNHPVLNPKIEFYGHYYELTKSMIFHKQMALLSHDKIFTFSPNIRMESIDKRNTGRHLVEFTQLDLEIKNATRDEIMKLGEKLIVFTLNYIKGSCEEELKVLDRDLEMPVAPFEQIEYLDAFNEYGGDFEDVLSKEKEKPFWIIDFPVSAREFYDRENPKNTGILVDMDMVYPEGHGEALSGGEREYEYEKVLMRMKKKGMNLSDFNRYLNIVKCGLPPSAGFGMGIERLTRFICGLDRIENTTLFPKIPGKSCL